MFDYIHGEWRHYPSELFACILWRRSESVTGKHELLLSKSSMLITIQIASLAGCSRQCSITTGCVAAAYEGGNCYLKSQNTGVPAENKYAF
jgi:hypothetical protein